MTIAATISRTFTDRRTVDFGLQDAKGRAIGARISYGTETRSADPASHWLVAPATLGHHITARVQATRDGQAYGASQRETLHPTRAEAEAAATARVEAARKRNARKFA